MSSWVRENFEGVGLTQSPPGKHLDAVQARYGGAVLLCIDVSGSMSGTPLAQAIKGGVAFLDEAQEAHYSCGLVLWHHGIEQHVPIGTPSKEVRSKLLAAHSTGGNQLAPTLQLAIKELGPRKGDRVLCVFGDGDVGNRAESVRLARELCAMGVRIVVRGLGSHAAEALSCLLCPGAKADTTTTIADVESLADGIASMANNLTNTRGLRG
jgi:hypothetical protein